MAAYYYSEKDDTVYKCTALTKEKDYTTVSMDAVVDADGDVMYELDGEAASVVTNLLSDTVEGAIIKQTELESVEIKKYLAEMDTFKKFADFPLSHNIYGNNSHGAAAKAYRKKAEEYGRLIGKNAEMHTSETQDASGVRVMLEFAKTCFVARVFFEMFAAWFLTALLFRFIYTPNGWYDTIAFVVLIAVEGFVINDINFCYFMKNRRRNYGTDKGQYGKQRH